MRTVFALLSGLVLFGVAIVNEKQNSQADDAVNIPVDGQAADAGNTVESKPTTIRLPVIVSEPTAAIHIDDELKEQIDQLSTRVDSTEERITALEQSVQESAEQAVQVGRIAMIESQLEDLHLRVDETQSLVTTGIEELKAAIAAIPEPVVALPEPQVSESDWSSEANPHYLLLFTTTNCSACETAKSQVDDFISHGWKIKTFAPDDPNASLYQVTRFPTWIALEHGEEVDRWTGADVGVMNAHLNAAFKPETIETVSIAAPIVQRSANGSGSLRSWISSHRTSGDWTYPGTIRGHLMEHGWSSSEIAGLSTDEMIELHDATHEGRISPSRFRSGSVGNSRNYVSGQSYASSSYSSCPTGGCPTSSYGNRRVRRAGRMFRW